MFTGIVEHLGSVSAVEPGPVGRSVTIDVGPLNTITVGDSMAVNGVCLTAAKVTPGAVVVEIVSETLARSNLAELEAGDRVNLERAMPADGRFDGHIVQGHVDGTGMIRSISEEGDGARVEIEVPPEVARYLVEMGSISVDGVSLTIAGCDGKRVEIALIPHTLASTTLGLRKPGDTVNLEVDVLGKYVERFLESR